MYPRLVVSRCLSLPDQGTAPSRANVICMQEVLPGYLSGKPASRLCSPNRVVCISNMVFLVIEEPRSEKGDPSFDLDIPVISTSKLWYVFVSKGRNYAARSLPKPRGERRSIDQWGSLVIQLSILEYCGLQIQECGRQGAFWVGTGAWE